MGELEPTKVEYVMRQLGDYIWIVTTKEYSPELDYVDECWYDDKWFPCEFKPAPECEEEYVKQ